VKVIEHYWFRAFAIAFASFALIYVALSALSALTWNVVRRRHSQSTELLFTLLAAPMLVSAATVLFLIFPAFLRFEPMVSEPTGGALISFAAIGVAIVMVGIARATTAWVRTSRSVRRWTSGAVVSNLQADLPILTTKDESPAAVVAGIVRPRLLISRSTTRALSSNELRLVVAHEREHARRRDNLRKLLLAANFMPFRRQIEQEWMLSCELAADRGAVANGYDACDLAAALVKVSRMACVQGSLATNFAATSPAILQMRVQKLISWEPSESAPQSNVPVDLLMAAIALASGIVLVFSGNILSVVHRITELWMY
jgi:Zn-dependent protease with chaperone function